MIIEDLKKEIELLNAEIRKIKEDQEIIIKAIDLFQVSYQKHIQEYHLKKKWWKIL